MAHQFSTIVQPPGNIRISSAEEFVLQHLFSDFVRVAIEGEFGMGLSGCRVFRMRPISGDGSAHMPVLVKIGPVGLIEKEWWAFETWVKDKLQGVAPVTSPPIVPDGSEWGGLRYQLVGGGIFAVLSLRQLYRNADVDDVLWVLQKRLFPAMGRSWWLDNRAEPAFKMQSDYDHLLPVNLMLAAAPTSEEEVILVNPEQHAIAQVQIGDRLRLQGFVVREVEAGRQQLTLNLPRSPGQRRYDSLRLRVVDVPAIDQYQVGDVIDTLDGVVSDTRLSLLESAVAKALGPAVDLTGGTIVLDSGKPLPNPLHVFPELLHNTFLHVNLSTIHGDFNLENILVDPDTRDVKVIDFATARLGHALHDLLRLETEIITKILPEVFVQAGMTPELIREFYWHLHYLSFEKETRTGALALHPLLAKPLAMLVAIRQQASKSFFEPADHDEYYQGLLLYLLGALKFKNLDAIPGAKALAFYGAATTVEILEGPVPVDPTPNPFSVPQPQNPVKIDPPPWNRIGAVAILLLAIAGMAYYLFSNNICTTHLCALDDPLVVEFAEGPAAHDELADYFAAANPDLYTHLDDVERMYLEGDEHKGLTYVWGPPGVGKSFVARNLDDFTDDDNCVVKLGDLFGDDRGKLDFEVIDEPDLITADRQIVFNTLPMIADVTKYTLENILSASECQRGEQWRPLIVIDDIDEVHSKMSRIILRSVDQFILETALAQQQFVHVLVMGRTEGYTSWYRDPGRNEAIVPFLTPFRLSGPEMVTTGDVKLLAEKQYEFVCGTPPPPGYTDGFLRLVSRNPMLTYSIRALAISHMFTDCSLSNPDEMDVEMHGFLFDQLLQRANGAHNRPPSSDERYMRILEEIAAKYARPTDLVDAGGFFAVSAGDTVPVYENGRRVGEVSVRDALDHSGVALIDEPENFGNVRYRFDPVWMHAHLAKLRNQRRLFYLLPYRSCDE